MVSNLLNNAAKYTDSGGWIDLTLAREGKNAVVRVRDGGRGIDPAVLPSIFDLFYQVDRNLDRSEGGLGIGLSLVKTLVEMHGGRVEARSSGHGKGSEFVVHLPILSPDLRNARAQDGYSATNGEGLRVLVVDDNRDAANTMAMLLELDGHEIFVAHNGEKAVDVALAKRPHAVLLDIGLPLLNGYDACRAMRAGGLDDALIMAMTGYGQEEDRRLSQEAGFDVHLVKPVDLLVVRNLLAQRNVSTPEQR